MAHLKAVTQSCETPEVLSSVLPTCTYSEMVPLFIELYAPDPKKITAIIAKIKEFQRRGLIDCGAIKRGQRNAYTPADLRRLLVGMELCYIGLSVRFANDVIIALGDEALFGQTCAVEIAVGARGAKISIDTGPLRDAARKHLPHMFTGGVS